MNEKEEIIYQNLKIKSINTFIENFKSKYRKELEDVFSNGYCYHFAMILKIVFGCSIMYIPIYNHFCVLYGGKLFDINGEIKNEEMIILAVLWEEYKYIDEKESSRIVRDCILHNIFDEDLMNDIIY